MDIQRITTQPFSLLFLIGLSFTRQPRSKQGGDPINDIFGVETNKYPVRRPRTTINIFQSYPTYCLTHDIQRLYRANSQQIEEALLKQLNRLNVPIVAQQHHAGEIVRQLFTYKNRVVPMRMRGRQGTFVVEYAWDKDACKLVTIGTNLVKCSNELEFSMLRASTLYGASPEVQEGCR